MKSPPSPPRDRSRARLPLACLAVLLAAALLAPAPAPAQDTEQLRQEAERRLGQQLTDQEIIRRLRQSGLSPEQIRSRLAERGFDPSAADPWLRALEGEASTVPEGASRTPVVSVLAGAETGDRQLGQVPARQRPDLEAPPDTLPPVFGRSLFRNASSQFQPSLTGPVPDDYQLGPGDRLQLVLTGAVEQVYELEVGQDGTIVVPEVGRVAVTGRTLGELRPVLVNRFSQVYSGVTPGPGGKTQLDVSVAQIRTVQVYVVGEVTRPSAYRVSGLATALTALYRAGGPTRNGSFRSVVVNRGGEAAARIDLYDYLLRGRAGQDLRLRNGDIVFVPVAREQVRISGPVSRPAIYELEPGDGLRDLIHYAGGVQPAADLERVQIERILSPERRAPGRDRAILDVPVGDLAAPADSAERIPLRDGDRVTVFAVLEETRNRVTVSGGVWRPGTYGATDSTRLWDVIEKAGGLQPDVYRARAQIQRLQEDYTRRLIPVSLERGPEGQPVENPRIEGMDQVYVFARRDLREARRVSIGGWVREPGVYPHREGMTVEDLILQAGGLRTGAYLEAAEVARVVIQQQPTDTLTRHFEVGLDSAYAVGRTDAGAAGGDGPRAGSGRAGAASFELENMDAVYVRKAPGFERQQTVTVTGEVRYPGPYSIRTRGDRLTDVVRRAGGLTGQAYRRGLQLWREADGGMAGEAGPTGPTLRAAAGLDTAGAGEDTLRAAADTAAFTGTGRIRRASGAAGRTRVGLEFTRALENPDAPANVRLQPGDSIHVPQYEPTVTVRGAVGVETKVLHREGAGLGYYIDQAGGYGQFAREDRTRVRYANGEIQTRGGGFLFFGGGVDDPDPGSTIFVPAVPPERRGGGPSLQTVVGLMSTAASAVATVIIATQ